MACLALVAGYPSILVAAAQTTFEGAVDAGNGVPDHAVAHSVQATLGQVNPRAQRQPLRSHPLPDAAGLAEGRTPGSTPGGSPINHPAPHRNAARALLSQATTPRGPPAF